MKKRRKQAPSHVRLRASPITGVGAFFRAGTPWRSLLIGGVGALAAHAILLAVLPDRISEPRDSPERPSREIAFVFPEAEEDPSEPLPEEYVATNPDVPSNPPDETRHFASRDQQAAQEEASERETPEETPRVEGEELRSQNIIEGDPDPSVAESGPPSREEEETQVPDQEIPAVPERRPIPGSEDTEPEPDEEGIHTVETEDEETGEEDLRQVGINFPEEQRGDSAQQASRNRPEPSPRPSLPRTHSGPVAEREGSASRVGELAIDARKSEFGTYLERMLEAIERQWHSLARAHLSASDASSQVRIRFTLDSSGQVEIIEVDSSATHTGTLICQDAIEARAPFGNWSEEMIQVLGDEQTMTITFHYR